MNVITCPLQIKSKTQPNNPAVIFKEQVISYRQFHEAVENGVEYFQSKGFDPNDRVAICQRNSPEYLIALMALWRMGVVTCLLSPRLPQEEVRRQVENLGCRELMISWPKIGSRGETIPGVCRRLGQPQTNLRGLKKPNPRGLFASPLAPQKLRAKRA